MSAGVVIGALAVGSARAVTYTVTSTGYDTSNTSTLAGAITAANLNPGSTINFNLPTGSTITLPSALPLIETAMTIDGGNGVTISGNNAHQVFFVDHGVVSIKNLLIADGAAQGGNGASGAGGGGGGLGAGGALFVNSSATVTVQNVNFLGNTATGGTGGTGGAANGGGGGGGFGANGGAGSNGGGGGGGLAGAGGGGSNGGGAGGGIAGNGGHGSNGGAGGGGTTSGSNASNAGGNGNSGAAGGSLGTGSNSSAPANNGGNGQSPVTGGGGGGGLGGTNLSTGAAGNGGNGGNGGTGGGGGGGGLGGFSQSFNLSGSGGSGGNGGLFAGGGGAGSGTNGAPHGGAGGDFGGGGGGSTGVSQNSGLGGAGGFGGGGGGAGNAGGALGGAAGFGAGAGGNRSVAGNGGDGYGGAIFVRQGGTLTIQDSSLASSAVTAGSGNSAGTAGGTGLYLMTGVQADLDVSTGSHSISDTIGGAGSLIKTGAGTLNLSGTNNYTGTTEISAGRLAVNGSINSNTTIDSGATLGGNGSITGNVTNNGIVGPGNSIGTLTVNGNYSQNSGGSYQVQINNSGTTPGINNDLLVVHGNAQLSGGVDVVSASGGYTSGVKYTFLEATTVSGAFTSTSLSGIPSMHMSLGFEDLLVGNTLYETVFFTLIDNRSDFAAIATNANQLAVATYIDNNSVGATGDMQDLINALNTLTPSQTQNALDQMSGSIYGSLSQTQLQSSTLQLSFLTRRIAPGLSDSDADGGSSGGVASMPSGQMFDSNTVVRGQSTLWPRRPQGDWNTWALGYGLGGNAQSSSSGATGFNYSLAGSVAGGEVVDDDRVLGVYGGYVGSRVGSYLAGQSARVNGGQLGVYYRKDDGFNYYILLGGIGGDSYLSQRQMQFGNINSTASGNYGGWQTQAYAERGVTMRGSKASLQPYAAMQYLYVRQNSFTETGAGVLDLNVGGIDANSLRSLIGMRLAGNGWTRGEHLITPVARALWLHEFLSTSTGLNAQFAPIGGSNFAVQGANLGRDWAILGAGLNVNVGNGWQMYANYDAQVNSVQTFHVGSGGFQYAW